jgi:poly(ADP-ribose) glycohydrolase
MKLVFFEDEQCLRAKKLCLNRRFLIKREVVQSNHDNFLHAFSDAKMSPLQILKDTDSIEEFYGEAKIDFANKYIGGGALRRGCVQEEIMYANHP